MIEADTATDLLADLERLPLHGRGFRRAAMHLIGQLDGFDWTGIYRLEGDTLVLDEFVGEPTDHVKIKVGVGVCGTAVAENRSIVVDDVTKLVNYLACSTKTRSEIVVLIRNGDKVLGQIDIDGHIAGQFDGSDEKFLEAAAQIIARQWEEAPTAHS